VAVLFALMAIAGPCLYPPNLPIDPNSIYAAPSLTHPLGTDFEGTDVLALVVTGSRYVLASAAVAAAVTAVTGLAVGLAAGYAGGPPDAFLMRLTDVVLTIPGFPLLLVLSTIWDFGSPAEMGLVLGLTGWGGLARAVRSQTLSSVTGAIYAEVGLFFLGVVPFRANNWGVMLNIAVFSANAVTSPQAVTYLLAPLVCILLLTLALTTLSGAADEWFNPRLRDL
jgi:peptide/nickel transport system permease protein